MQAQQNFNKAIVIQPKLTVNTPGDQNEQEADAMADRVMRMSSNETARPVTGLIGKSLQRKCAHCEEEEKKKKPIMRKAEAGNAGMAVSSSFAADLNASKGGGSPLPDGTRSFMENAFSADFSDVKIHTDSKASEMSKGINAKAFTHFTDIYFGAGQYSRDTSFGKNLLAHELTHVVQQTSNGGKQIQRFSTDDCSRAEIQTIDSADARATHMVSKAMRILGTFINDAAAGKQDPLLEAMLLRYFGNATPIIVRVIKLGFNEILNTLAEDDYQYECEDDCDNENAYVYDNRWTDIHLCMNNIGNNGSSLIARTIVHEMSHYVNDTDDEAYCKNNSRCPPGLSIADALDNADSYACLAYEIYTTL